MAGNATTTAPSVEKLEMQVDDILKQLDEVLKTHAAPGAPDSEGADATGSAKDNEGGMKRRVLRHTQQVKDMGKKANGEGGDEDRLEKLFSDMESFLSKAKKDDPEPDADDEGNMDDTWSGKGKKTTKRASDDADDETLTIGNQTISKAEVGEAQFDIFKGMNERLVKAQEEIEKHKNDARMANLRKRADDEFEFLPGTTEERAQMLKAIEDLPKDVRASFEKSMTTANKLAKSAFDRVGVRTGDVEGMQKSADSFTTKISEIKKRDSCSRTEALEKARKEDPDGFKAYQSQS